MHDAIVGNDISDLRDGPAFPGNPMRFSSRVGRNRRLRHGSIQLAKCLHSPIHDHPNDRPDVGNDVSDLRNSLLSALCSKLFAFSLQLFPLSLKHQTAAVSELPCSGGGALRFRDLANGVRNDAFWKRRLQPRSFRSPTVPLLALCSKLSAFRFPLSAFRSQLSALSSQLSALSSPQTFFDIIPL